ncbi:hypothetical protein P692DRAFT_20741624 [Suillus brevipes Sb2]|nr:hypothetical protein P692DRAFT_20741624 [Suillus brevipes Sb2]
MRLPLTAGTITHPSMTLPVGATTAACLCRRHSHRACTIDVFTSTCQRYMGFCRTKCKKQ